MKVLLVGNYASDRQHSMLSFPTALRAGLDNLGVTAAISSAKARFGGRGGRMGKWAAYVDKYVVFPRELRRLAESVDVVHVCDQGNAMYVNWLQGKPHVVTCHDLLAIRSAMGELSYWQTGPTGKIYQKLNRKALGRARMVACVSDATLADCKRIIGLPDDRLRLIWNGMYKSFEGLDAEPAISGPYLLHVGGNQPYKNRPGAVAIFQEIWRQAPDCPLSLVFAGEPPSAELMVDGVVGIANPSDSVLAGLYRHATALLVSSFDEGFSLPILEAQSCGCPVIVNDKAPMKTVAGAGGLAVDVLAPTEAAAQVLSGIKLLGSQRETGLANAAHYSLERMSQGYADAYKELV